ncbi:MAG: alpha/beta hydrolase [Betaproteobacteria bacterium]|nr:alpha/beta hydrolase [Betaproteobacteria bacterium]
MSESNISFQSQGLRLAGVVRTPANMQVGERRPAFLVLHGFGSNKGAENVLGPCAALEAQGYVTMRFDMRGCGESEGERGNLICLDQVQNTRDAYTFLNGHPAVQATRIGVIGSSFGAAVAVYAGAIDERFSCVISSGGWGHGERKFRGQHPGPEAWAKFTAMLEEGKRHRARTGQSLLVPRMDIVPIPPSLKRQIVPGSIQAFTAETAQSMFDFRAEDVVAKLAPRPLLLLHSSVDSVTPTEQSIEMFKRAGMPADLHLFGDTDHFMLAEGNQRVWHVVAEWLEKYFPL